MKTIRILPLGDSLTLGVSVPARHSFGGYRVRLWKLLTDAGISFDFVGSARAGPPVLPDKDHEGHPGWRIDQIHAIAGSVMARFTPHIVLLIAGSNDIYQCHDLPQAPERLAHLVDDLRALRAEAQLLIGNLPLMSGPLDYLMPDVEAFNEHWRRVAEARAWPRVTHVDMASRLMASDLYDGVHPTDAGYQKMADAWFEALTPLLSAI